MFEVFADTGRGEDGEEAGRRLGVRLFLDLLGLLVSDHLGRLDLVVRPDHRVRGGVRVSLGSGSKTHGAESGLPLRHQYCSAALRSGELLLWMGAECTHLCLSAVYVCLCSCVRDTLSRCICVCLLFYLPVCPFVVCFSVCVRCECMWGRGGRYIVCASGSSFKNENYCLQCSVVNFPLLTAALKEYASDSAIDLVKIFIIIIISNWASSYWIKRWDDILYFQVYVNNSAVRQLEANTFRGLKISNLQISHAQVII